MAPLRWGLIGTGNINNDFAVSVLTLPRDQHVMVGVSSGDQEKARKFSEKFSIPKFYGKYDEVASDPEVDIVYIGTTNSTHYALSKLALENNKHVLCEKPLTLLLEHTEELCRLAKEKGKFFLEGVWSRFFPAYKKMREELPLGRGGGTISEGAIISEGGTNTIFTVNAGTIGDVKFLRAEFGMNNWIVDLFAKKDRGGSSTMDIGVYPIQFAVAVYGPEMPKTVKACGILNDSGVEMGVAILLQYEDGRIAQLMSNFVNDPPNEGYAFGSKGNIKLPYPFWCPSDLIVQDKSYSFPLPEVKMPTFYTNMSGLVYEAQEVYRCINEGLLESPFMTHQETITIARIMDAVKKEIGLNFHDLYEPK